MVSSPSGCTIPGMHIRDSGFRTSWIIMSCQTLRSFQLRLSIMRFGHVWMVGHVTQNFRLDLPHQSILAVSDFHPGRLQLQWQLGSLWGWSTIGALGNESNHWQRCTNNIHRIQPAKMGIMTKHRRKHVYINYIVRYSQYYNIYIFTYT